MTLVTEDQDRLARALQEFGRFWLDPDDRDGMVAHAFDSGAVTTLSDALRQLAEDVATMHRFCEAKGESPDKFRWQLRELARYIETKEK